jgi:hypothetical protein
MPGLKKGTERKSPALVTVFSQEWYLVPAHFDCRHCGVEGRGYGLVLGPRTQIGEGALSAETEVRRLGNYGVVRAWKRADWQGCDFITSQSEDLLQMRAGELRLICEHCHGETGLEEIAPAVMENFVQWGALRAMRDERQLIVSKAADVTHFHEGAVIDSSETIGRSFAVVARGGCTNEDGVEGSVEIMLDLTAGSYGWEARFGPKGGGKGWSASSAVAGREIGIMVEQLAQAGIRLSSLTCADDAGPVCLFAYEQVVDGLLSDGYGWAEKEEK